MNPNNGSLDMFIKSTQLVPDFADFFEASVLLTLSSPVRAILNQLRTPRFPRPRNISARLPQASPKASKVLRLPAAQCHALENLAAKLCQMYLAALVNVDSSEARTFLEQ